MVDILVALLDIRWIAGMVIFFFLAVIIWAYLSAMKEERFIEEVKNKHFKYFTKEKYFEKGSYVLKIKYELQEDSELQNKVILRYFHDTDTQPKFKKMCLVEEGEGPIWVDSRGFQVDQSYFDKRSFVLDARKKEVIFKSDFEGSIDDYWERSANDVRFWKCVDTPFELKKSA